MTSLQAAVKIKNALNKLDSKDYPNVSLEKIEEATNTATLRFVRRRIDTKEATTKLVDDLQILLKTEKLAGSNKDIYFISHKIPADYFGYSKLSPIVSKGDCPNRRIVSDLEEDANIDVNLADANSQPSWKFEQCFHTIGGNKFKVYHNKEFEVKELELTYYREPQYITYPNTAQFNGGIGKDMSWEWKEDVADMIIEETIMILAGNIENYNRNQLAAANLKNTN